MEPKIHTIKPFVLEVARLFVGFWEFFSSWLLRNSSSRCRADSIIDFSTRVSPELSIFHRKTNDLVSRIDKINKFGDTNDRNKFQRYVPLSIQRLHVFTAYSAFKRVVQNQSKRANERKGGKRKENVAVSNNWDFFNSTDYQFID